MPLCLRKTTKSSLVHKPLLYTLLFGGWMVFITLLSLFSFSPVEEHRVEIPHLDKLVHFGFYAVATFLGCLFLKERSLAKIRVTKALAIMVSSLIVYGIIIEVLQWKYTTWRDGDVFDAIANVLGALAGGATIKFLYSGNWQLKWKN